MPAQLIVMSGPDLGREFALPEGRMVPVGRSQATITQLTDPSVSRLHLEIDLAVDPPVLHNRSGNGTYVNGKQVTTCNLRHGDVIRLGMTEVCFSLASPTEASTLAPVAFQKPAQGPRRTPPRPVPEEETTVPWTDVFPDHRADRPRTQPVINLGEFDFLSPPLEDDEIGRLAHYRVLSLLGEGGMGWVFRAEDSYLQRPVALKVMKPATAQDIEGRQRFVREARSTAQLKNDHIVTIYQVGLDNDVPYLAMELLEGESLHARLQRGAALSLGEVLQIGREAALGLAAAHDRGVIHRDVKPENLWLEKLPDSPPDDVPTGPPGPTPFRVKLLDFGLARPNNAQVTLTRSGWLVGTPDWMAPEQARGDAVDHRCDLFSLGTVLFFLCTGRMPFVGTDIFSLLAALVQTDPGAVADLNPVVPTEFSDLIGQLLSKDPTRRPATAHVVARRVQAIESHLADPF
jgi:tRNA A-37 threonylcarbamoyl transferase component Bud32